MSQPPITKKQMVRKPNDFVSSLTIIDIDRRIKELGDEMEKLYELREQLTKREPPPCNYIC
jgi:hypothetical protein